MPATTTMSGKAGRFALELILVGIATAGVGVRPAVGQEQGNVVARAVVPATNGGRPATSAAVLALAAPGWPVASGAAGDGPVVSQWLCFSRVSAGPGVALALRLAAAPTRGDSATVQLAAQAEIVQTRDKRGVTLYAQNVFNAFSKDILAGGPPPGHSNLKSVLNFIPNPSGDDFLVVACH